jgi:hypothetical protein
MKTRTFEAANTALSTSAADDGRSYVNDMKMQNNNYENLAGGNDPYGLEEIDVQTVHSEGVASNPPPLEKRFNNSSGDTTLGDISQADDRVKKFYGIIPKQQQNEEENRVNTVEASEIKTVRMVKRDSKERNFNGNRSGGPEDSHIPPPPPLPRGNYHNLHDFLQKEKEEPKRRGQISTDTASSRGGSLSSSSGDSGTYVKTSSSARPNFVIGGEQRKKSEAARDRPGSSLSAHERLFGSSRENSLSPPMSPSKVAIAPSPVFKSATAKAIAEEVGKVEGGRRRRNGAGQRKQRSHTISGGNPAIMEALNEHQAKMVSLQTIYFVL